MTHDFGKSITLKIGSILQGPQNITEVKTWDYVLSEEELAKVEEEGHCCPSCGYPSWCCICPIPHPADI